MRANRSSRQIDVVLAGLYIHGTADLRHLSQSGYSVCGITHEPHSKGIRSRHGTKRICPDPEQDLEAWAQFMEELGRTCGSRPALIATEDRYVLAFDKCAERLSKWFRIHGFGTGLRSALTSKRTTFDLADRHGFPMPRTRFVDNWGELEAFFEEIQGPVLIKPEFSMHWRAEPVKARLGYCKVMTATTLGELRSVYDTAMELGAQVVVQELIPGPDANQIYWAGFVGADSVVRGRIVGRKLRVLPIHYGSGSFVQLVDMPEVEEQCARFLKALGYVGRCGIDLKIDERDGQAKLIEVNPRAGLWEAIGVPVGVDLAREAVEALFGRETEPHRAHRFDYKWVHVGRDLAAFRRYRREGSWTTAQWLRSLTPPIVVSDFPIRDDPSYAWANLTDVTGNIARKLLEGRDFRHLRGSHAGATRQR